MDPDRSTSSRLDSVHYPLANLAGACIALLTLALPIGLVVRYSSSPTSPLPMVMQPASTSDSQGSGI